MAEIYFLLEQRFEMLKNQTLILPDVHMVYTDSVLKVGWSFDQTSLKRGIHIHTLWCQKKSNKWVCCSSNHIKDPSGPHFSSSSLLSVDCKECQDVLGKQFILKSLSNILLQSLGRKKKEACCCRDITIKILPYGLDTSGETCSSLTSQINFARSK